MINDLSQHDALFTILRTVMLNYKERKNYITGKDSVHTMPKMKLAKRPQWYHGLSYTYEKLNATY